MKKNDCPVMKIVKIVLVVVATLAALAAGYVLVQKLLCKKKKSSGDSVEINLEGEGCADCCFDNSDCADCPIVEDTEYAEVPVEDAE